MSEIRWAELTTTDPITADIYKSLLESSDIPVFLRSDATYVVHPFTMGMLGDVDILVPKELLELAKKLIKEVEIEDCESDDPDCD